MRKYAFMTAILALAVMFAASAWATGRLNFMLINKTGHDIVDAKICPTYFPQYESKNLLQKALDSNTRVYIGPNYYGEQEYWNIALKWANGFEHTFTKLRLTRYNTYTVYSTPEGVRILQTYEPAYARYEFGPDAPSYMDEQNNTKVTVSAPEKLSAPEATPYAPPVEPGKASAQVAAKNLTFADDNAKALAMKTTVERTRNGQTNTVSPSEDFKSGDQVRLLFSTNKDGHVYWVSKDADGQYEVLFPTSGADNSVTRNKEYSIPGVEPMQFGDNKGSETIFAIFSPKPIPDMDKAVQLESQGKKAEASKLVADAVKAHEQKRTAGELVFEEEDVEDVNSQSQLADGEEFFIGSYELVHE